jgi:hypothetical protein
MCIMARKEIMIEEEPGRSKYEKTHLVFQKVLLVAI